MSDTIPDQISESDYIRQRLNPRPGEIFYLHLIDLLDAVMAMRTTAARRVLDFGAGGSPYRTLFPDSDYKTADIGSSELHDYQISANGTVPETSGSFDLILSSQVLEHVTNADEYLNECYRLLKPGGCLLLSTHGIFEEHGCPYDFRRWTADGLRLDISKAGFVVETVTKLTTGPRALLFLLDRHFHLLRTSKRSLFGIFCRLLGRILARQRGRLHRLIDANFSSCKVVDSNDGGHALYIALLAFAKKPAFTVDAVHTSTEN